jgi:hypothetical protein
LDRALSADVELDYDYLAQRALRRVVRDALEITAELGEVPGKHHFFIEFATRADGVDLSADLRAQFPERMTIVLQHQFENLKVDDDAFAVTLWFKGKPARLVVPFQAVTSFADPGAEFGLRFDDREEPRLDAADMTPVAAETAAPAPEKPDASADVVSLDKFRRK